MSFAPCRCLAPCQGARLDPSSSRAANAGIRGAGAGLKRTAREQHEGQEATQLSARERQSEDQPLSAASARSPGWQCKIRGCCLVFSGWASWQLYRCKQKSGHGQHADSCAQNRVQARPAAASCDFTVVSESGSGRQGLAGDDERRLWLAARQQLHQRRPHRQQLLARQNLHATSALSGRSGHNAFPLMAKAQLERSRRHVEPLLLLFGEAPSAGCICM